MAVDDRSTDATGAILDAAGGGRTARGWRCCMWRRCRRGGWARRMRWRWRRGRRLRSTTPDYLLFTDGDIVFRQDAMRRSLAQAVASGRTTLW